MLPKYLIVFVGLPGTGKSTLAYRLGKELNFVVIDKDILKSCLLLSNISG
jgi:predicted kinase